MGSVLIWWLALEIIAIVALPLTLRILRFLPDRGLGLARHLGLLVCGYLFWLLVSLGVLQNTLSSIVAVLGIVAAVSVVLWLRHGEEMGSALRDRRSLILITEGLFLAALLAFALFRAYNPDIAATEKPMEFAFINGILRSRTFPPLDPWLAGYSISYYYLGYVLVAMLTRLTGLPSDITFNLAGITLFALTVNGAFTLAYNMVQAARDRRVTWTSVTRSAVSAVAVVAGMLGAVLVALMGNLVGIFELIRARGWGSESLWRFLDVRNLHATAPSVTWYPDDTWWWWRASRVIHDRTADGGYNEVISEFPFFSFLLGDNHPHVLALPFVLLALAVALNVLLSHHHAPSEAVPSTEGASPEETEAGALASEGGSTVARWWGRVEGAARDLWPGGALDLLVWALLLGSLGFLNTWDYPTFLGIFMLAYALRRVEHYGRRGWSWLYDTLRLGLLLTFLGVALYLPFYLGFRSQAGGIGLVGAIKTRPQQYLLMFGPFVLLSAGLLIALVGRSLRAGRAGMRFSLPAVAALALTILAVGLCLVQGWWTAALAIGMAGLAAALLLNSLGPVSDIWSEGTEPRLLPSSQFALLLLIGGFLLTAVVEFIFLRDVFGTRMNTVFKFYYQAWVLLGIASAYGAYHVAHALRTALRPAGIPLGLWALVAALPVLAGLSYTVAATVSKAGAFAGQPTLNGAAYVARFRPDEYQVIQWLKANAPEDAVLLEASGGSYSEYNWISAHTGIPTLLGWDGHELQWRGNYDVPSEREPAIADIYQSPDVELTRVLLDRYHIDYVIVGPHERLKYHLSEGSLRKLDLVMRRVVEQGEYIVYAR
ncbi:MAG: DUF2298 domain-containing protein [Anaerolineae bacterium]